MITWLVQKQTKQTHTQSYVPYTVTLINPGLIVGLLDWINRIKI